MCGHGPRQLVATLRDSFFPRHEVLATRFLLDLVDQGPAESKRPALLLLRCFMPYLSSRSLAQAGLSQQDLIGPLFRLLGTDYADETLLILENAVQSETANAR